MRAALCVLLCSMMSPIAMAQVVKIGEDNDETPPTYKMTVSPAAEPQPALKYRFLVPPVDQVHGNAATLYYKVLSHEGIDPVDQLSKVISGDKKYEALFEGPLSEFPQQEAEELTRWMDHDYGDWLTHASRCDYCEWEDGIRERGISTLLPQAQKSRALANAIALRARLQIARKQYDKAIETLRWGYALSRNLGHGPTIVQSLIGIAIQGIMDEQLRTLIEQDNSPNLYWGLSELAAQPVSMRHGLSYETQFWEFTIHGLQELDRRPLSNGETVKLAEEIFKIMALAGSDRPHRATLPPRVAILGWAVQLYPQARANLLQNGYTAAQLDEIPVLQVVLLYRWRQCTELRDDYFKWALLPDDESRETLSRGQDEVEERIKAGEGAPFAVAIPALRAALAARLRFERQTDLLRAVEALRMYAAVNGRWPEKLDDVTIAPVPRDPWTGQPFEYSVEGGVAKLAAEDRPGDSKIGREKRWPAQMAPQVTGAARYELTLRKAN